MNIKENNEKFKNLREEFKEITYEKYNIEENNENIILTFTFILSDEILFQPSLTVPKKNFEFKISINDKRINNIVFNIGLIELLSYWKCACPPTIIIKCGMLNENQINWWKKLYFNGLGEFFYTNSIETNINDFVNFETVGNTYIKEKFDISEGNIIPVGGGKDSIVTLETLKNTKEKNICLIINPRGASINSVVIAGYEKEDIFEIYRKIDPKLLELNSKGFLNGHTPFSAMLAFISIFSAILLGKKYIALSNESSANESNVENSNVNHQYSKSFEFENDFQKYIKDYITEDVLYFSLLRPLSEIQIVKNFSKYKKYFKVFKSCNSGYRINAKEEEWCGKCPKCLFAFILVAAFLSDSEVIEIFGRNLLDDIEFLETFKELVGEKKVKPFECVGTRDEINVALSIILKKYKENEKMPCLLEYYKNNLGKLIKNDGEINREINGFNKENSLPIEFLKLLNK